MKYSILALLLLSSQAHSLTTECDDGYVYKLARHTAFQAMDEHGKPQVCEERKERRDAALKVRLELMHKHQLELLKLYARPYPKPIFGK